MTKTYDIPKIIIIVEGGVVQDVIIRNVSVIVEVRDYDTDGTDDNIATDDNGDVYAWEQYGERV
jgi:hypothetical protein